jgi:PAS domain S-box-containing protein
MANVRDVRVKVGHYSPHQVLAELSFEVEYTPLEIARNHQFNIRIDVQQVLAQMPQRQIMAQAPAHSYNTPEHIFQEVLQPDGSRVQRVVHRMLVEDETGSISALQGGSVVNGRLLNDPQGRAQQPAFGQPEGYGYTQPNAYTNGQPNGYANGHHFGTGHAQTNGYANGHEYGQGQNGHHTPYGQGAGYAQTQAPANNGYTPTTQQPAWNPESEFGQLFARNTTQAIIICDAQGGIEWVNEGFTRQTGYTLNEIRGQRPGAFLQGPNTNRETVRQLGEAIRQGRPITVEIVNYTRSRSQYTTQLSILPVVGTSGRVERMISWQQVLGGADRTVHLHTTQDPALLQKLSNAENTIRSLFESAPVGICITTEDGNFENVNGTYCSIYGYNADELIGQPFTKVVPKNKAGHWNKVHQDFIDGNNHTRGEFEVLSKKGKPLTILADSAKITGNDGRPRKVTFVVDITERKNAEHALRVSEDRLQSLVNAAPVGICVTNKEGLLVNVNETYSNIYGYTMDELIGQPFTMVVPKDKAQQWMTTHERFLAGEVHTRGEFQVVTKRGKHLTILADSARIPDSEGNFQKVTYVLDITERKRNEELLRLSEDRMKKLVNAAPVGICVTDKDANFVSINDTYCAIYGYTPEELIGQPFTKVVPKDKANQWITTHNRFLAGEVHTRGEFNVLTKHGKQLTILADSARILADDGTFQKVTYVLDITERKRAEELLRLSEDRMKQLVNAAPVGICVTDKNANFVSINDTYCSIYGYTPEELIGQPFTMVVPKDKAGQWIDTHNRFLAGEVHTRGEFNVMTKQGKQLTILADSARILADDGSYQKVTYVLDITDRKRSEVLLRLSEDRMKQLVNAAPVGICVTNKEGNFVSINDTYCAIYGYTPEELIGNPFTVVVPKDKASNWIDTHNRFLAGEVHTRGEFNVLTKKGRKLTILADSARILADDGSYQKVTYVLDITERKRAEELLRLSEERMKQLVNAAPVGICVTNKEGNFVSINDTYCAIYGYAPEELVGNPFTMVVPKDKGSQWKTSHDRFLVGEVHTRGEFNVLTKTGKQLTILADSARIMDDEGNYQKVTYVLDITDRKRNEELVKESEERLSSLVNAAPLGIVITNEFGIVESVNDTYCSIYGYDRSEFISQHFAMVVPPTQRDRWVTAHDRFIAGQDDVRGEFQVLTKGGVTLTVLADALRIFGTDGRPRKVTFVMDITERKRNEEALKRSEDRNRKLIDTAPVGICVTSEDGLYESVNSTYCDIYGYNTFELLGQPFTMVVPEHTKGFWNQAHENFIAGKEDVRGEFQVLTKDGKQLTVLADSSRIIGLDGRPKKVTFVLDITERKYAEQELKMRSEELRMNLEELQATQEAMRKTELQLRASESLTRTMIETAPVGICVTDENAAFETVNETYSYIYGFSQEELAGKPFVTVVPKEDIGIWNERHQLFLAGKDELPGEFAAVTKSGEQRTVLSDSVRIIGSDGKARKVTFVLDITERKRAEIELRDKGVELKNNFEELQATQEAMRRAQLELQLSEVLNRSVIETAPVGIAIVNQAGDMEMLNSTFCSTFGYAETELMGKPFTHLAPKKEQAVWANMHADYMAGSGDIRGEFVLADARGRALFTLVDSTRITGLDGLPKRVTFVVDITQLKENEMEARKLSLIASRTDNGIFTATAKGELEWVNDGFTRITSLALDAVAGKAWDKVLIELGADKDILDSIRGELGAGKSINSEVQIAKAWLSLSLTPVLSSGGMLEQYVAILNDITDKKKKEVELANALKEIKGAQEQLLISEKMAALGQLIAGVAHEVNTPISAVKASVGNMMRMLPETISELPTLLLKIPKNLMPLFKSLVTTSVTSDIVLTTKEERTHRRRITDILEEAGIENAEDIADNLVEIRVLDEIEQYLPLLENKASLEILDMAYKLGQLKVNMTNIDIASEKTAKVVQALKNYSHVQSTDRLVHTTMAESLDTILMLYHNQTKYGIEVERVYDDNLTIWAYPDELGQVWTNIIQNAIQAMTGSGKLEVHITEEDKMAVVRIIDNGPGIPQDIITRVFEPFFTTKSQGEGTGLGLDITRKIIEKHHGKIGVESVPGRTCFTVSIPVNLNEIQGETE